AFVCASEKHSRLVNRRNFETVGKSSFARSSAGATAPAIRAFAAKPAKPAERSPRTMARSDYGNLQSEWPSRYLSPFSLPNWRLRSPGRAISAWEGFVGKRPLPLGEGWGEGLATNPKTPFSPFLSERTGKGWRRVFFSCY